MGELKLSKKRNIDYSTEEMAKLSGMSVKKFTDKLKIICDDYNRFGYNLNILDFKLDEWTTSDYHFPPEIAEPLAILIKNSDNHPYNRKNYKDQNVTALKIADYTKGVLNDIDNSEYSIFKDMIYSYNAHTTSLDLANWISPFIRALKHFLINSLHTYENIGQAISYYTRMLDSFNYNLHRGTIFKQTNNIEKENISIDHLLVRCINEGLTITKQYKKEGIPDFEELLESEIPYFLESNPLYAKDTKEIINYITNLPVNEQRKLYLNIVLRKSINTRSLAENINIVNIKKESFKNWNPRDKRIENGDEKVYNEEIRAELLRQISNCEQALESYKRSLEYYQEKLKELDQTGECSVNFNTDNLFMATYKRHQKYVAHCQSIDNNPDNKKLEDVLDHMVGQALKYYIDND